MGLLVQVWCLQQKTKCDILICIYILQYLSISSNRFLSVTFFWDSWVVFQLFQKFSDLHLRESMVFTGSWFRLSDQIASLPKKKGHDLQKQLKSLTKHGPLLDSTPVFEIKNYGTWLSSFIFFGGWMLQFLRVFSVFGKSPNKGPIALQETVRAMTSASQFVATVNKAKRSSAELCVSWVIRFRIWGKRCNGNIPPKQIPYYPQYLWPSKCHCNLEEQDFRIFQIYIYIHT